MNLALYKKRIQYDGDLEPTLECLRSIHLSHVLSVPFEALDITFKQRIHLGIESIYKKVITNCRGGYCYELNHLFYNFLNAIGFNCKMISSRIYDEDILGPEFDHMSIVVYLDEPWLVDVGYGDLFLSPIQISSRLLQEDGPKFFKIDAINENEFVLSETWTGQLNFKKKYLFDLKACTIDDFENQNRIKQVNPESYFVKNTICTLPTKSGRKTIFNDTFKVSSNEMVTKKKIEDKDEMLGILRDEFNITIP